MILRTRSRARAAKARRRKPAKRRHAAKAVVRHGLPAASEKTTVALIARERDEALEQFTAASEVLKVLSLSSGDLKPVFDMILKNAVRICEAKFGVLYRCDNETFDPVALFGAPPAYVEFLRKQGPFRPAAGIALDRLLRTKAVIRVDDYLAESVVGPVARFGGARSLVEVPMLKENVLVGAIVIFRQEVRPFSDRQVELLSNFADQAVIAIENTRLLKELRESLRQQTATADILRVISSSPAYLKPVLDAVAEHSARLCNATDAAIFNVEDNVLRRIAHFGPAPSTSAGAVRSVTLGTVTGQSVVERRTVHIHDILEAHARGEYPDGPALQRPVGYRTVLVAPLLRGGAAIGAIIVRRMDVNPFSADQIKLLETFADQAVIAFENVRLFNEIQDKSRQLAEASQHKSQFLANMSHELRTPLNAILGYTELVVDGIYGTPPEKMQTVLKRIESNGKHLLGLINAVLDLSKIEAGQLKLDLAEYSLRDLAYTVHNAVEPLAVDKKLKLKAEVAADLPQGHGDERRLTQVLLNLVGNAIKFTDAGEVVIKADASGGVFNLSIRDTGPGISAADQAKLFQEFQQADNSITRQKGGTGLGLAISKRIIEMHGGRIWVESSVGQGSTFFVTVPIQVPVS